MQVACRSSFLSLVSDLAVNMFIIEYLARIFQDDHILFLIEFVKSSEYSLAYEHRQIYMCIYIPTKKQIRPCTAILGFSSTFLVRTYFAHQQKSKYGLCGNTKFFKQFNSPLRAASFANQKYGTKISCAEASQKEAMLL